MYILTVNILFMKALSVLSSINPHHSSGKKYNIDSTFFRQYHVSKVYFYSVRDVLTEDESAAEKEHVSILDCETGRVRKGYAQPGPNSPGM